MSKVIAIQKAQSSGSVPVVNSNAPFTQVDFLAAYGSKTPVLILSMLYKFYNNYKKSEAYQNLSFAEKVDMEFQFEILRRFIYSLKK
jgi:hypothetical protein